MNERDTEPAPAPDEPTQPRASVPGPPSTWELTEELGQFAREMRDSLLAVRHSGEEFVSKLEALEKSFERRLGLLANEVNRVHQENITILLQLREHERRIEALEERCGST